MYFSKWDTMGNLSAKNVVFCYGAAMVTHFEDLKLR